MSMSIKKRLVLGAGALATVGAAATLIAGVTFGFFSATTPVQSSSFTAGTVTLSNPLALSCDIGPMSPGDTGSCTFSIAYGGNVPADIGMDVALTPTPGSPVSAYSPTTTLAPPAAAPGLYDGTATGLQLAISDSGGGTYNTGDAWTETTLNSATPSVAAAASANNILVASDTTNNTFGGSGNGGVDTFTITYTLPSGSTNAYQGAATTLTFLVHAVQYANNGTPADVAPCTPGAICAAIPSWA